MESEVGDSTADYRIVRQVLAGDTDAYARLVARYQNRVFAIVGRHVPGDSVPEIAQEIFVDAYRSLGNYSPLKGFDHWLTRIAIRRCHDYWRSHYRRREVPMSQLDTGDQELIQRTLLAEKTDAGAALELREFLERALERLHPDDRLVLTLVYLEEHSMQETAELLEWSVAKVKVRAHRARKSLREYLQERLINKEVPHG